MLIKDRFLEIFTGIIVLLIIITFVIYSSVVYLSNSINTYKVTAKFTNIGPLIEGSKVKINGVNVGKVTSIKLNNTDFTINVILDLVSNVNIPMASKVEIQSSGLLEPPYIVIIPNKDNNYIKGGEIFLNTKDFVSLDEKIGNIFLNINSK